MSPERISLQFSALQSSIRKLAFAGRQPKLTGLIGRSAIGKAVSGLLAATALLSTGFGAALWLDVSRHGDELEHLTHLGNEAARLQLVASNASLQPKLAETLPRQIDSNMLLARFQRIAAQNAITVISLAPSKDSSNKESAGLRRVAWDAQLNGDYAAVKSMLAELLEQTPELWLSRLHIKAAGTGVDAQLTLQAWSFNAPDPQPRRAPK